MNRRRRGNPEMGGFPTARLVPMGIGAGAAFLGARFIPENVSALAGYNTGWQGYALNAGVGVAISYALKYAYNRDAFLGGLIGTGLAVVTRIMTDQSAATPGVNGDLSFNLAYYSSDRFPFPQGAGGPYTRFPGQPYLSNPPFGAPTAASAVVAGQAAAAAALPAAARGAKPAMSGGWRSSGRW